MQRVLDDDYVLDDDPDRIDRAAVHAFLTTSYWAEGRTRALVDDLVRSAARVVGLYGPGVGGTSPQLGFARVVSDIHTVAYLADVYVLEPVRGRGFGLELVRFAVDVEPFSGLKWILHTRDMQPLYAQLGFGPPGERTMERGRMAGRSGSESTPAGPSR